MDDDLQRFIHSVESSAKKILKDHTKRVHEEAARERVEKVRGGSKEKAAASEEKSISREELKAKYGQSALIIPAPKDKAAEDLPHVAKASPRAHLSPVQPSQSTEKPIALPSLDAKRHKQELREKAASKLLQSPLYKGLTKSQSQPTAFKHALAQLNAVDDLRMLGLGGGKPGPAHNRHQHNVERRMCNACWAEPMKHTGCEHNYRANPDGLELQGATSWSFDDLHFKYRAEREREAAWSASMQLQATDSPVVPVLERHPLYEKFFHTVDNDNAYMQNVSRAKNQTKKFVLDVNRVWLTNLDHFNAMLQDAAAEKARPTKGLRGRHDLGAIRQGYSQIQSVSMACAMKNVVQLPAQSESEVAASEDQLPQKTVKIRSPKEGLDTQFTPLSILACGRLDFRGQVPGTVVLSSFPGLWWCTLEFTRPTAMYVRDAKLSSTNTILVNVVLALDSPVLAPTWFAWVPGSVCAPFEREIATWFYYVPCTCMALQTLPNVVSPLDDYMPSPIFIANAYCEHAPEVAEFNAINFRQWLRWATIPPNFESDAQAYGIVQGYPNQTGLNGRFSWHSDEVVDTPCLIRPRLEADYAVHARNLISRGGNDPNMYTLNMRHEAIDKITTSGLRAYLAAQEKVKEEERLRQQMLEIETKLQAGRLALDAKRAEKRRLEAEAQLRAEQRSKQLDGSLAMPESTIDEWRARVQASRVVKEWNGWEERELNDSHVRFYHHSNPSLQLANQWQPPDGWPDETSASSEESAPEPAATSRSDVSSDSSTAKESIDDTIDKMASALVENENFLHALRSKLGLLTPRNKNSSRRRRQDARQAPQDSSSEEELSDDEDTVAGRVLRVLAQDDSLQDTNSASVKRLTRLQILKESPQLNPVSPGEGWKRLKPTRLPKTFAKKVYTTTIAGPTASFIGQPNAPLILGLIDPAKTATYEQPNMVPDFREHFVPNLDAEAVLMKKVLAASAKKATKQTIMQVFADTIPDEEEEARQRAADEATEAERIAKAVVYARNNNIKELEGMLDEGVNINARDENGNTLFILACQQGNKNMCKFLMRRRCEMNAQNFRGNTGLHYCYEYKWTELANYLKEKGAKDDIPNAEGLMCYEGISSAKLQEL